MPQITPQLEVIKFGTSAWLKPGGRIARRSALLWQLRK